MRIYICCLYLLLTMLTHFVKFLLRKYYFYHCVLIPVVIEENWRYPRRLQRKKRDIVEK